MWAGQIRQSLAYAMMLSCCASIAVAQQPNEVFTKLIEDGVALSDGAKVKLPKPVMADGLSAAAQQKVMAALVAPARLADFSEGKVNSWFEFKKAGEPAASPGKFGARKIDLYYVANGPLEALSNKGFIKEAMGEGGDDFHIFNGQEVKQENLDLTQDTDTMRERYAHAKLDLFNMAKVEGTGHGVFTSDKDSVLIGFVLDPNFAGNKSFPNQWRKISLDEAGKKVIGEPHPYEGFGGYFKVTRVADAASPQVFIESHLVFEEPFEWFNGKGTLMSKLDDKFRADIRSFRRRLADFAKSNPNVAAGGEANAKPDGNAAKKNPDTTKKPDQVNTASTPPTKVAIEAK
jgi:hypothetical protein